MAGLGWLVTELRGSVPEPRAGGHCVEQVVTSHVVSAPSLALCPFMRIFREPRTHMGHQTSVASCHVHTPHHKGTVPLGPGVPGHRRACLLTQASC